MLCSFCDTDERKISKLVKVEPPSERLVMFFEHPAFRRQKIIQTTFSFPVRHLQFPVQLFKESFLVSKMKDRLSFCTLAVNSDILFHHNIQFSRFHCDLLKNWSTFWEAIPSNARQTRKRRLVAIHSHYNFPA